MGCNCGNSYVQYSTVNKNSNSSTNIVTSCTYSLEELNKILNYLIDNIPNNTYIISIVQSQINVYNSNCNKFISIIEQSINIDSILDN